MNRKALYFTAALAVLSLCACGGDADGSDGEFYAVISSNPDNLDPQMAEDKASMFVIRNTYALLMDTDGSGRLINGAAKSYTVSDDGLTYTFKLRDGLFWFGMSGTNGVPLTAYDYEYAFQRIFDAATHSPYVDFFSCIKNSKAVYGGGKSRYELGVKAIDNHVTLERINSNSDEGYKTYPQLVNIIISNDRKVAEKSKNFESDAYIAENIGDYDTSVAKDYDFTEYICGTTCLFLNSGFKPFSDIETRKALLSSVDKKSMENELSDDSILAWDIVPEAIITANKSFRELFPVSERSMLGSAAKWKATVEQYPTIDFNSSILLASDSLKSQSVPYYIISEFEKNLELYCSPVFMNESDFEKSIRAGEENLFIDTVYGNYNLSEEFLSQIYSVSGFKDDEIENDIIQMQRCSDLNDKKDMIRKTENALIDNAYLLPVSYEKKYLLTLNDSKDIYFDPYTESMFFKYAKK